MQWNYLGAVYFVLATAVPSSCSHNAVIKLKFYITQYQLYISSVGSYVYSVNSFFLHIYNTNIVYDSIKISCTSCIF